MVTELKLRVAKYYDYAFSGEGTYSNVVHSECADVSQGAVYPVHALCLLVWVQSEHSWENPFCRPPNLIKLSPALRHELSTIFHKVYVFYESRTLSLFRSLENGSKSSLLRNFPGVFVPTISFRQSCKGERVWRRWKKPQGALRSPSCCRCLLCCCPPPFFSPSFRSLRHGVEWRVKAAT